MMTAISVNMSGNQKSLAKSNEHTFLDLRGWLVFDLDGLLLISFFFLLL